MLNNLREWIEVVLRKPTETLPRLSAGSIVAVLIVLAAIIALMFFVDAAATDWARGLPASFTNAFEEITNFGLSGWFLIPFGIALLCLAALASPGVPKMTRGVLDALAARLGFLFLAIGAPGLFDTIVKRLIGRARPYVGTHDDPFAYRPFVWQPEYASMPSGHATTAAAAAIAIGAIWPKSRPVMWLYALIIMFSRVVVIAHHPSDVLGGALVGGLGAWLVVRWFAARRLVFSAHDLRAFPGASLKRTIAALHAAFRA